MGRYIYVKVRVTADSEADSEATRAWLAQVLPALVLARGRPGNNPKYEGAQKVLAYGDLVFRADAKTGRKPRGAGAQKARAAAKAPKKKATEAAS